MFLEIKRKLLKSLKICTLNVLNMLSKFNLKNIVNNYYNSSSESNGFLYQEEKEVFQYNLLNWESNNSELFNDMVRRILRNKIQLKVIWN